MKLMYALRAADPSTLLSGALRDELATAGVTRLQLNLDDEDVRPARLRISTYDEPVQAIASAWTDGAADPVTRTLAGRCDLVAGWVVDEAQPLPPPDTDDGRRAEALANVALLRIPDGMARETWLERWKHQHTQVAIRTQATFGYVQNLVVDRLTAEERPVDALVEELFPPAAMTDLHAFYGSGGDPDELRRRMTQMTESTATFGASTNLDLVPSSRYVFRLEPAGD